MKALIVDDEGIERRGVTMLIRKLGLPFETDEASNGEIALGKLKSGAFDVLLTDIKMPFMDGLTLAHEARMLYPELPIVVFTAYADFAKAQRAIRENVCSYLLKPVIVLEFKSVMEQVAAKIENRRVRTTQQTKLEREIRSYRIREAKLNAAMSGAEREDVPDVLHQLLSRKPDTDTDAEPTNRAIVLALHIIHTEYMTELTQKDVAERVFLTPSYFSTLFRRQTGKSFVHYLNEYRLDQAMELLRGGNRPVREIAKQVGYCSDSYFILQFKERLHCTPQQYRSGIGVEPDE